MQTDIGAMSDVDIANALRIRLEQQQSGPHHDDYTALALIDVTRAYKILRERDARHQPTENE